VTAFKPFLFGSRQLGAQTYPHYILPKWSTEKTLSRRVVSSPMQLLAELRPNGSTEIVTAQAQPLETAEVAHAMAHKFMKTHLPMLLSLPPLLLLGRKRLQALLLTVGALHQRRRRRIKEKSIGWMPIFRKNKLLELREFVYPPP
jgi:hypothetical protein